MNTNMSTSLIANLTKEMGANVIVRVSMGLRVSPISRN